MILVMLSNGTNHMSFPCPSSMAAQQDDELAPGPG